MKLLESNANTKKTMSSLDIAELTGKEHKEVLRDLRKILGEAEIDAAQFCAPQTYGNNNTRDVYNLPRRECDLVVSGYSVKYRLAIIDRWQELEAKERALIPQTYKEALLALVAAEEVKEQQLLQIGNLSTALDVLSDWASILKVAKHNKVNERQFSWRKLKAMSEQLGYAIKKAESPRFGYQNLYNIAAFKACYPQFNYSLKSATI